MNCQVVQHIYAMKQTSKENVAEVGFEPTTSGLQVVLIPSELASPMMGPIP